jgi:DnaJ-class molecular chaperone
VKKSAGPAFNQEKRPLKPCPHCHGAGFVKSMFYQLRCDNCEASGVVCKETGESLAMEDLVIQLRIRLNERNQQLKSAHLRLAELRGGESGRGYGAGGSRYHGD